MILPIIAFGSPILRKRCVSITPDYSGIDVLIDNMWETMYAARGVGLAAPQINKDIRLFLIDTTSFSDDEEHKEDPIKKVFINARIITEYAEKWSFNEGCLSIPGIREDILRNSGITIEYQDEHFKTHIDKYDGIISRIIQHEYDHIEGVLFTDKISPLRKRMLKGKLMDISKGKVSTDYKMKITK